jgi:hypothetical protein
VSHDTEPVRFRNFYRHCGELWEDTWSCACNDECPVCGKEIEPYKSTDVCPTCEASEKFDKDGNCKACGAKLPKD